MKEEQDDASSLAVQTALAGTGEANRGWGEGQIPRAFPFVSYSRHLKDICLSFYAVFGTVFHGKTFRLPTMRADGQTNDGQTGQHPVEFGARLQGMTVSLVWHWQHIANTFAAGAEKTDCIESKKRKQLSPNDQCERCEVEN